MPKKKTKKQPKIHSLLKKFLFTFFFVALIIATASIILAAVTDAYFGSIIQNKEQLINNKNTGLLLLDDKGEPFFSFYNGRRRRYIPLSEISKYAQWAAIVSEDKEFYQHHGVSIRGVIRSLGLDVKDKSLGYGGSTITQQLVKNVLLTPQKSLLRKFQEVVLAQQIERHYTKDEILEMYLNSIYFGEGSFGIEDASQTYFGKDAKDLTLSEASFLISLIPSPSRLSPYSGGKAEALKIQKKLLAEMVSFGSISQSEMDGALKENLHFKNNNEDVNNLAPHFALMVRDELIKKYGEENIIRSGYTVKTTLHSDWQEYAEVSVKNHVQQLSGDEVSNGAIVAMDPKTGEVKALVGSADWADPKNGKVNMAVVPRQPGSSFKPFIYARALENRSITPATVLKDEPLTIRDPHCPTCQAYSPKDYDGRYRGNVLVRRALANSLNIPAVEVMQRVGVGQALATAKDLGIDTLNGQPTDYGLSLVLGAGEVPLVQMVHAYSSFADKGKISDDIKLYTQIKDKKGQTIYSSSDSTHQVWPVSVAFLISSILSDRQARAEEFGSALDSTRIAAVKTGTTNDYKDAWTIGYTPDLVVGVWVGNNDNTPMDQVAGSLGAAPIWRDLIEKFSEGTPDRGFDKPSDITEVSVCKSNGLRSKEATSSAYPEYFIPGTEPVGECKAESTPTGMPFDLQGQQEQIQKMLQQMQQSQQDILNQIQQRRAERRGRFKNN